MSKLKDLAYDIEALYIEGLTEKNIAKTLDIPVEVVYAWQAENGIADDVEADAAEWDELEAFDPSDY
jgi:orotate phosphoribosyltransferase-like protein